MFAHLSLGAGNLDVQQPRATLLPLHAIEDALIPLWQAGVRGLGDRRVWGGVAFWCTSVVRIWANGCLDINPGFCGR